jgi:hypothetical protein
MSQHCPELLRSVVTDGVTIGHPCCSVHNCKVPLSNMKRRFCDTHILLESQCAVQTCTNIVISGQRTCHAHGDIERSHFAAGKGMFQLQRRYERQRQRNTELEIDPRLANIELDDKREELEDDEQVEVTMRGDARKGNGDIKAVFGRRRTSNQEVAVTSCGVIIGHGTFYGAEGPMGVIVRPSPSSWHLLTATMLFTRNSGIVSSHV